MAETTMARSAAEVRLFHIDVPEEAIVDLKRGLAMTRWPEDSGHPTAPMRGTSGPASVSCGSSS
jgi:hypothetical protein